MITYTVGMSGGVCWEVFMSGRSLLIPCCSVALLLPAIALVPTPSAQESTRSQASASATPAQQAAPAKKKNKKKDKAKLVATVDAE